MSELTFNEWQLHIRRLLNYPEDRLKIYEDNLKLDKDKDRAVKPAIRTKAGGKRNLRPVNNID